MIFEQIRVRGDNFSYLVGDEDTRQAAVIDPSGNEREILRRLDRRNLQLKYVILTHSHPDHTGGTEYLAKKGRGKVAAHESSRLKKDIALKDGQQIELGGLIIEILHTPGHTPDGICVIVDGKVMTGDTLFVRECGRTDLPGSDSAQMYVSLNRLKELPPEMEVWPGHDYGPKPSSTIGEEVRENYTLEDRTLEDFIDFMKEP